jgi:flagellar hook-associated protein 2
MSQGLFSISGLGSGMDTQGIIQQLLSLERIPVTRLQQQQADLRKVDEAWGQVNTRLSALRTALDKIRRPDHLQSFINATSSNPDAVGVATRGTGTGNLSFTVNQLATTHQIAGGAGFASSSDLVGEGAFTVTIGGVDHTVETTAATTLSGLARQLNDLGAGVSAKVIKVGEGDHQLVLSARETGEASTFAVTTNLAGFGNLVEIQTGQDALLSVGSLQVRRSSNTIDDLVDGATITLKRVTADPVTVSVERDIDGAVDAVKEYHKTLNEVLSTLKRLSAYDAGANKGQALSGDATARRLVDSLRSAALGNGVGFGVGFSMDRDGSVKLDEAKLRAAFTADFDATVQTLTKATQTSTTVLHGVTSSDPRFITATAETQAGTYNVEVFAATGARAASNAWISHANTQTLHILIDGATIPVTVGGNATVDDAAATINSALAGTTLSVAVEGGGLVFTDSRTGPESTFQLQAGTRWQNTELAGPYAGQALRGTIDGHEAAVDGENLVAIQGPATGLTVSGAATGAFAITLEAQTTTETTTHPLGLFALFDAALKQFEGSGGGIARARQSIDGRIKLYQDRIDAFEKRIEQREITLRRQFTALETAMGQMNSQGAWLSSQLAGLQNFNWGPSRT